MKRVFVLALTGWASLGWAGDAQHGAAVVEQQGCLQCHTVNAQGIGHEANATAPDLGIASSAPFTPAAFAGALWNHTPAMWMEVSTKNVTRPALAETDWADVFAYLYSEQIFQFPAQVRRGEDVFRSKECAACHSAANGQPGLPVPLWKDVDDPAVLVYQMWNHAATMNTTMRATFDARKKNWPKMDGRDFGDLAAYVQSVQRLSPNRQLSLPEAASGKAAFGHYCEQCHQGPLALETRLANKTFLDIGAGVWNHVPQMGTGAGAFPTLSEADMRKILAYVWDLQVRGPEGNVTHGELAFAAKGCAGCHTDAQTHAVVSPRPGKVFTPFSMAAIAWGANRDVPSKMPHRMHREMWNQGAVWPTLSPDDVSDLAAFMNYASRR